MTINNEKVKSVEKYIENILGQREAHQKIYQFVDSMDNDMAIHYLEEVYDNDFIYRKVSRNEAGATVEYFKVSYSFDDNEELKIEDDVTKVKRTVSYEAVSNNSKGGKKMAKKETTNECPNCKELIDGLIANEHTAWKEDHRIFLEEMDEETLKNMVPVIKEPTTNEKEVVVENEDVTEEKELTEDEYIANAPAKIQEVLKSAMSVHASKKAELVNNILANERNIFTKEQLEAKDVTELEGISKLATVPTYEAQGGVVNETSNSNEEEAMDLPTINWDHKKTA